MPHDLQCRYTLLGSSRTPESVAPMSKFNPRFLIHRADADSVLATTILTAPQKSLVPLPCLGVRHLIDVDRAAMNASRGFAPSLALYEFNSGYLARTSQRNCFDNFRLREMFSFLIHGLILYLTHTFVKYKIRFSSIRNWRINPRESISCQLANVYVAADWVLAI